MATDFADDGHEPVDPRAVRATDARSTWRGVRAVQEYLAALESQIAEQREIERDGQQEDHRPETPRRRKWRRKTPKVISPSDPMSAWTAKANKRVQYIPVWDMSHRDDGALSRDDFVFDKKKNR